MQIMWLCERGGNVGIQLFAHNAKAYSLLTRRLQVANRAAIIHPTGTGKSYIAFKLIEDNPHKNFLWLSPSDYIFRTQKENLHRSNPELNLNHVRFATYAKLTYLLPEDLALIEADYIILDEFHRCGALQWGEAVEHLLNAHPCAKVVGLSATHVRYLDNQRDMAEELFGGNIASEMTLGEAIVRGILPAPQYVTTLFRYQKELERYQKRVDNLRSPGIQDFNQKYLDALRRALEQADGLDTVFARYMTEKSGRYILFCSDAQHMREMMALSDRWFKAVNLQMHCYSAYSDDPATDRAFAAFQADNSPALKLLFCIDMLNEGVHMRDVAGVILLRPTISPIVYKQQIGRALTAGGTHIPLIIDVVNNIEGLCSISYLQEEVRTAVQHLYAAGEGHRIVVDQFEIEAQTEDCRRLFEQLDRSLSSSWEQYFHAAGLFSAEHGHLNVPKQYKTETGLSLGTWITTQRKVRAGQTCGSLSQAQIDRLDSIGMIWENRLETAWEKAFSYAEAYYKENGNLLVPARYKTADGFALGKWIVNLRQRYASGEQQLLLSSARIARLNEIGMVWDAVSFQWEENFRKAEAYYRQHGDLKVQASHKTSDGFALGAWLNNLRQTYAGKSKNRPLTEEQIQRLESIGMQWDNRNESKWQIGYRAAQKYFAECGDLEVPVGYVTADGVALGKWIRRQRYAYCFPQKSNAQLTPERVRLLEELEIQWRTDVSAVV